MPTPTSKAPESASNPHPNPPSRPSSRRPSSRSHLHLALLPLHPQDTADLRLWVEGALKLEAASTGIPWATILKSIIPSTPNKIVSTTRFIDLDLQNLTVEIGNTWLSPTIHGAGINPEAKLLQLTCAFETHHLRRVALKTHHQNLQSQAAMRKLGAQYEGTFRNHYVVPDNSARHSVWFSITQEDWPAVKASLQIRLQEKMVSMVKVHT
jgi:RimJ/RimL family protein N-acetyltransferase